MLLENRQIMNSIGTLEKLVTQELPIKVSYYLKKNVDTLNEVIKNVNELKNSLIAKYGDGSQIDPNNKEAVEEFWKEFNQILDIKEDVNIKTLAIDDLVTAKLSVQDINNIMYMIKEEEE